MLIAGGAILVISYIIAIPYFLPQGGGAEYSISPGETITIIHDLAPGQAAFSITFQETSENPIVAVEGPSGDVLYNSTASGSPLVVTINAAAAGNHTLFITNRSSETLQTVVLIGEETVTLVLAFAQVAGIIVLAAGAIVTVLDKVRNKKMKQFGDMSDLR
jgi:hypothetical protein